MANIILKKVQVGNPLFNLGMFEELAAYDNIKTDEELADFYHILLQVADELEKRGEAHSALRGFTYSMISFSTGRSFNINQLFI